MRDGQQGSCARASAHRDRDTVRAFLRDHLDDEALRVDNPPLPDRRRAADFSRLNRQVLGQIEIAHAVRLQRASMAFLIATVPDGIDSFTGWAFDPAVDAIRLAAEHSGYVMDRFFVPDWSQRPAAASTGGKVHEEQPGAMIFRSADGMNRAVLVVLLALESPTSGVHAVAMDRAIRVSAWWRGHGAFDELRILGPTYSGTTASLQQALRRTVPSIADSIRRRGVWIVSGSATRPDNQNRLQGLKDDLASVPVTFDATTQPDNAEQLRQVLCTRFGVGRMAWLTESNTDYGARKSAATLGCNGQIDVEFTFPLHISRLRDLTPGTAVERPVPGAPVIPLVLREAFTPTDAFPSLSPALTSAGAEVMLRNIGRLIARERILVVGITATDARDKLFLARTIKQAQPSVSFVTTEANVLYSHPDYADSVRGMLVASSYPLTSFVTEHSVDDRTRRRMAFSSSAAEGVYNAGLVLMNAYDRAHATLVRRLDSTHAVHPYARESISAGPRRPSLWFSLVGREDTWPIGRTAIAGGNAYTLAIGGPSGEADRSSELRRVHPGIIVTYLLLTLIVALHVVAFLTGRPRWMRKFASRTKWSHAIETSVGGTIKDAFRVSPAQNAHWIGPLKRKHQGGRYRRQFACFAALLMVFVTCGRLLGVWKEHLRGWERFAADTTLVITIVLAILLAVICLTCLVRIVVSLPLLRARITPFWAERVLYSCLISALCATCIYYWIGYMSVLLAGDAALAGSGALAIERYVRLSNGLSPLLPLVLLASAVYLWGVLDLTGYPIPGHRRFDDAMQIVNRLARKSRDVLESERGRVLKARLLAVAVVVLLGIWLLWLAPVFSFEGPAFGLTYTAAVLLVHALVAPKLIAVWYRWGALSRRLDDLTRIEEKFVGLLVPAAGGDARAGQAGDQHQLNLPKFSPGELFRGPRLPVVEQLCDEYAKAIRSEPSLLETMATGFRTLVERGEIESDADLQRLLDLSRVWEHRWKDSHEGAAADVNPLLLLTAIDRHRFDTLFEKTVEECAPVGVRVAAGGAAVSAGAGPRGELADRWRSELAGRMPEELSSIDCGDAMCWIAAQKDEARDARKFVALLPVFPASVKRQLEYDRSLSPALPAWISRAWAALSFNAGLLAAGGLLADCHTMNPRKGGARFLALHLVASIQLALWQIWKALAFVMAAVLLLMISHLVYPIQPRGLMLGAAAAEVLIAVALAVRATFAVERNAILSRLTGGTAGQIDWSWGLAARLVGWAVVPIAGVVATRFPDIGDVILRVFSPFESFMR
jgi:hypothetical protein